MSNKNHRASIIHRSIFGEIDNSEVYLFKLSNAGMDVSITNYGATIVSVNVPDRNANKKNVITGFNNLEQYLAEHPYFGCIVGRYANRIAYGRFSLSGIEYTLPITNGANHLHGGVSGFNKKLWKIENIIEQDDRTSVELFYRSSDNEEGYPGNLDVTVTYSLTRHNELIIDYSATTDKPTIINLTNHSYFNLTAFEDETIYKHELKLYADSYTVKNDNNVPSGEIVSVRNTPLDLTTFKKIGEHIHEFSDDRGYDHNYVLPNNKTMMLAAELYEPRSGRLLKTFTNQPGIQVYTANWFDGTIKGAQNKPYLKHGAIALETQAYPDAPNHPNFPDTILLPGKVYSTTTVYQFDTV